jgi:hypothetical protein
MLPSQDPLFLITVSLLVSMFQPDSNNNNNNKDNNDRSRLWEKSNTLPHKLGNSSTSQSLNTSTGNGAESPKPSRKRFGSASEETILKVCFVILFVNRLL